MLDFFLCNRFELTNDDLSTYLPAKEIEKHLHLGKEVKDVGVFYCHQTSAYLMQSGTGWMSFAYEGGYLQ